MGSIGDDIKICRAGIEAARDRRTIASFNDQIGDAIEREALAALGRLADEIEALVQRAESAEEDRDKARSDLILKINVDDRVIALEEERDYLKRTRVVWPSDPP